MNCATCRQRLHPYLDDELEVSDHVAILEHLDRCAPCRGAFFAEERMRKRLKATLTADPCPERVRAAFFASMALARRKEIAYRFGPAALVAAAAIVAAVVFRSTTVIDGGSTAAPQLVASPIRLRYASRYADPTPCDHDQHGRFVEWAEAQYDGLVRNRVKSDEVLGPTRSAELCAAGRELLPFEALRCAVHAKLGRDLALPREFVGDGVIVGGELLDFDGVAVPEIVVAYADREVVIYEAPRDAVRLKDLHGVPGECGSRVALATCPECDVVAITCPDRVVLLVSRQFRDWSRDWMIEKARTF